MSPEACSHPWLSAQLTWRIPSAGPTRVMAKACFMCEALLPPLLSSSILRTRLLPVSRGVADHLDVE
jgi:hypothetical protein